MQRFALEARNIRLNFLYYDIIALPVCLVNFSWQRGKGVCLSIGGVFIHLRLKTIDLVVLITCTRPWTSFRIQGG